MPRFLPAERGASAVELALVLPILMSVLGIVLTTGLRMVYVGLAEHEARTVVRTASIRTTSSSSSPYPDNTAANRLALCGQGAISLPGTTFSPSTGCVITKDPNVSSPSEGDLVTVTLTYQATIIQKFVGWLPANILNGLSTITASASASRE
jgi:Flp pilus assembly protein TadG